MSAPIAAGSGIRPVATRLVAMSLAVAALAGCRTMEEPGAHAAGWTLVDASQRHPILVSQQPATLNIRVPSGAGGLSAGQAAQVADFLTRYRNTDHGNSKLVIAEPSGSPNEGAAMRAAANLRVMVSEYGFSESVVAMQPYGGGRDPSAPIRLAYLRYVAEGPECGTWPTNLGYDPRALPYPNFGCAQQHNLAAQIANPADLLGPRTMQPPDAERRTVVVDRYRQGKTTGAEKSADERAQAKGSD
jgi:pilus assembly protein CpaD